MLSLCGAWGYIEPTGDGGTHHTVYADYGTFTVCAERLGTGQAGAVLVLPRTWLQQWIYCAPPCNF